MEEETTHNTTESQTTHKEERFTQTTERKPPTIIYPNKIRKHTETPVTLNSAKEKEPNPCEHTPKKIKTQISETITPEKEPLSLLELGKGPNSMLISPPVLNGTERTRMNIESADYNNPYMSTEQAEETPQEEESLKQISELTTEKYLMMPYEAQPLHISLNHHNSSSTLAYDNNNPGSIHEDPTTTQAFYTHTPHDPYEPTIYTENNANTNDMNNTQPDNSSPILTENPQVLIDHNLLTRETENDWTHSKINEDLNLSEQNTQSTTCTKTHPEDSTTREKIEPERNYEKIKHTHSQDLHTLLASMDEQTKVNYALNLKADVNRTRMKSIERKNYIKSNRSRHQSINSELSDSNKTDPKDPKEKINKHLPITRSPPHHPKTHSPAAHKNSRRTEQAPQPNEAITSLIIKGLEALSTIPNFKKLLERIYQGQNPIINTTIEILRDSQPESSTIKMAKKLTALLELPRDDSCTEKFFHKIIQQLANEETNFIGKKSEPIEDFTKSIFPTFRMSATCLSCLNESTIIISSPLRCASPPSQDNNKYTLEPPHTETKRLCTRCLSNKLKFNKILGIQIPKTTILIYTGRSHNDKDSLPKYIKMDSTNQEQTILIPYAQLYTSNKTFFFSSLAKQIPLNHTDYKLKLLLLNSISQTPPTNDRTETLKAPNPLLEYNRPLTTEDRFVRSTPQPREATTTLATASPQKPIEIPTNIQLPTVKPLPQFGNNCFVNSALQILFSIPNISNTLWTEPVIKSNAVETLRNIQNLYATQNLCSPFMAQNYHKATQELLKNLNEENCKEKKMSTHEQNDASELIIKLIEHIEKSYCKTNHQTP
jgi:hypothetical protein